MKADMFIITEEDDGKSAFGPYTREGVIAFGREVLAEGFEDAVADMKEDERDEVDLDFSSWTDDEVWDELIDMGYGVKFLERPALSPREQAIAVYLDGMPAHELELMYGETLGPIFAELVAESKGAAK